jgi:hypothetical protein
MNRILALPRVTRLAKRNDFSAVCSARNRRGQQITSVMPSKDLGAVCQYRRDGPAAETPSRPDVVIRSKRKLPKSGFPR